MMVVMGEHEIVVYQIFAIDFALVKAADSLPGL
jgi:hypothetical protein